MCMVLAEMFFFLKYINSIFISKGLSKVLDFNTCPYYYYASRTSTHTHIYMYHKSRIFTPLIVSRSLANYTVMILNY